MARITSRVWGTFIKTLPITFHFEQTGDFKWLRICMGFQSRDLILIGHPIGAHHLPVNIWPRVVFMIKKMVLCAIFGCGTRSGRDKGINMARIYLKLLLVEEKKYGNFPKRGETNGFLRSAGKTSWTTFWITAGSVVNILSPEKWLNCGIVTIQIGLRPNI